MKIMIMDDDQEFAEELSSYLTNRFLDSKIVIVDNKNTNFEYDVFFLDIDMPGENGIDIAKRIRAYKEEALIIYVSFREDLVFDAMQTFPHYFLRKKYLYDELEIVMEKLARLKWDIPIAIKYQNREICLNAKDICYLEKEGNYLNIKTDSNVYKTRHSVIELTSLLPSGLFGTVSQGFVANFKYVQSENKEGVVMSDGKITYYSRGKRNAFLIGYIGCIENG